METTGWHLEGDEETGELRVVHPNGMTLEISSVEPGINDILGKHYVIPE